MGKNQLQKKDPNQERNKEIQSIGLLRLEYSRDLHDTSSPLWNYDWNAVISRYYLVQKVAWLDQKHQWSLLYIAYPSLWTIDFALFLGNVQLPAFLDKFSPLLTEGDGAAGASTTMATEHEVRRKNSAAELLKAVEGAAGRTTAATRPEVVTFKKEKNGETEHLSSAIF